MFKIFHVFDYDSIQWRWQFEIHSKDVMLELNVLLNNYEWLRIELGFMTGEVIPALRINS